MKRAWPGRIAVNVLITIVLAAASVGAIAESADDIVALNKQVEQLYRQGKYKEAVNIAEKALALGERVLGREHSETLRSLNNLATLYDSQGRYPEAEPLLKRALEIRERVLGKEHPHTLISLNNLAHLYQAQGRYPEAEPLYKRALEIKERVLGKEHPDTLLSVSNLAALYKAEGRYPEAEPLYKRALEVRERVLGKEHPDTLASLNNLAALYDFQGRGEEAEPLLKRALEGWERALGKEHPRTLASVNNLAHLYQAQGRYNEAEPLYKRALEAYERVLGRDHPQTLLSLNGLANLYGAQGRYSEAEPLYKRVLEASERVLGKEHPSTLVSVNSLAATYRAQRRYPEAEPLFKRALEAHERVLGREHPETLRSLNNLATLYDSQGRYPEAEPLYKRALEVKERVLGKEHPDTLLSVNNLASLYQDQRRYPEAEPLYKRALEARERVLGKEHPDTLVSLSNLASLYYAQRDWGRAAEFWRRSTTAIAKHEQRGAADYSQALTGKKKSETERVSHQFWGLVKAVYRLAPEGRTPDARASRETFETAQWAQSSEAAASLSQMAARGSSGDPRLARVVRERQDLLAEWQKRDGLRNVALGQAPEKRNAQMEAANRERLAAIDARIGEIDGILKDKFSDYAALVSPAPLTVEELQSQLGADEVLVLFLDIDARFKPTPEETFIWVVTKTDLRWVHSDLGTKALVREVQALRCGLDEAAWEDKPCVELTGQDRTEGDRNAGNPLPFDHARAYKLYQALFGQVEDLIKGKQLLIVPSGPLTQLPFQVLVTAPPASGDYKSATWIIRDHAITVLPAVSSLKALRRVARPSTAARPMIGFGNPLLDGDQNHPRFGAYFKKRAQLARDKQRCPETALQRVASLVGLRRGVAPMQTRRVADVAFLRMQLPLPETADELCAVARDVRADLGEIRLGARATEREVKRMSETGQLAQYRVVHFATHGVLAGQLDPKSDPGLILTPPESPSEEDDGYLTASEIAALKLDADWVILSACNTAAGDAQGAEALSGLARAFIYAQARALLVSHWEVNSDATVKLVTGAISRLAADKSIGRAEAVRRSMLALIENGASGEAHPAYWAPFVVVGEGATAR
jgi:CHAT domain-containing protein/tetratricopeptide (TPR) repeat protein